MSYGIPGIFRNTEGNLGDKGPGRRGRVGAGKVAVGERWGWGLGGGGSDDGGGCSGGLCCSLGVLSFLLV